MFTTGSLASAAQDVLHAYHAAVLKGHDTQMQWIPSHCGIAGNEAVDAAARRAVQLRRVQMMPIYVNKGDAGRMLNELKATNAQRLLVNRIYLGSLLYNVDPELRFRVPPSFTRQMTTVLHRLRLNAPYSAHVLFKGKRDSPNRSECGVVEDVEHILLRCPKYVDVRRALETNLSLVDSRAFDIAKLLGPPSSDKALRVLQDFLHTTGLMDIL
ncbi:uncharacterized protein LOC135384786 [Ornithodoros turicata]|uniref:uncharacterized protein LOC135384786 n=1 Tax=Ornithodoros turicata TaxID=34597 RepID=UPI0031398A3A